MARLREYLGQAGGAQVSEWIGAHLARVLADHGTGQGAVLSGYWPIKGEPDLRPLLKELHGAGVTIALPVVETRAAPLVFRRWTPETKMVRGDWNIPVPPPEAELLTPDITLAPCLGWSDGCYRLGWGGRYFDRTLAVLDPRPMVIGIVFSSARLPTIYPQSHDIPLDLIVAEAVTYAHARGTKVLLALNTYPPAGKVDLWRQAADLGVRLGVDAFIVADMGVADYIARTHPQARLHLSVQAAASSPEAIHYYCAHFGVRRVVLPRILTIPEIRQIKREIPCEIETFNFGNHGLMVEGRCSLTNYLTGQSTNMDGVCSPASDVEYARHEDGAMSSLLAGFTIDRFGPQEKAGYPTICKGRYTAPHRPEGYYAFEEPVSLNLSRLLPDLIEAGVHAFKIEGRQRSKSYVRGVVRAFRAAVDDIRAGRQANMADLVALTEGQKQTQGAFKTKKWRKKT